MSLRWAAAIAHWSNRPLGAAPRFLGLGRQNGGRRARDFTWGFQLNEEHPRGQFNASMAAAEAMTDGAWWRLFNVGPENRFDEPTVTGIDFPDLTVNQAWWDTERERLLLATTAKNSRVVGRPTSSKIVNLRDASAWRLESDDALPVTVHAVGGALDVATTIDSHRFALQPA